MSTLVTTSSSITSRTSSATESSSPNDAGTGALLRKIGPNDKLDHTDSHATCDPDSPYFINGKCVEERWDIDGFGRVTAHYRTFDHGATAYDLRVVDLASFSDPNGLINESHAQGDPATPVWIASRTTIDGVGRTVEEMQSRYLANVGDAYTDYVYDASGALVSIKVPDPRRDGVDPTTGRCFQATYSHSRDGEGRPTAITRPDGSRVVVSYGEVALDGIAWATTRTVTEVATDGSDVTTMGAYDPYGRLIEIHEASNPSPGNDALTTYRYDDHNRLVEVNDADGSTRFTSDWLGNRTQVDRDGRVWKYQYNAGSKLVARTSPMPAGALDAEYTSRTTYDSIDRPLVHSPARRNRSAAELDALAIGPTVLTYDQGPNGRGQLTSMSQARSNPLLTHFLDVGYSYDSNGLLAAETRSANPRAIVGNDERALISQSVSYSYDASGKRTAAVWDDGQRWFQSFDERGLVQRVEYATSSTAPRQTIADYGTRSNAGVPRNRVTGAEFGNQSRAWTYDILGRPSSDVITAGSTIRAQRTYSFYQTGDLKSVSGAN